MKLCLDRFWKNQLKGLGSGKNQFRKDAQQFLLRVIYFGVYATMVK
jgi:hypothetical protein